jgi:hypothetical protein
MKIFKLADKFFGYKREIVHEKNKEDGFHIYTPRTYNMDTRMKLVDRDLRATKENTIKLTYMCYKIFEEPDSQIEYEARIFLHIMNQHTLIKRRNEVDLFMEVEYVYEIPGCTKSKTLLFDMNAYRNLQSSEISHIVDEIKRCVPFEKIKKRAVAIY